VALFKRLEDNPFRDRSDVVPISGWNSSRLRRFPTAGSTLMGTKSSSSTMGAPNGLTSDLSPNVFL
jgi:hypothetical protein